MVNLSPQTTLIPSANKVRVACFVVENRDPDPLHKLINFLVLGLTCHVEMFVTIAGIGRWTCEVMGMAVVLTIKVETGKKAIVRHRGPAQTEAQWSAPTPRCSSRKQRLPDEGELHVAADAGQPNCNYILGRAILGSGRHSSSPGECQDCI